MGVTRGEPILPDLTKALNDLRLLVEVLRYEGGDTGPGGSQADLDRDRIVALFDRHGITAPGPFVCPYGCGRVYPGPEAAADCWRHNDGHREGGWA